MSHSFESAAERYKINVTNISYIDELKLHLETRHPLDFLRKKLVEIDSSLTKLPASRFSVNYWKIRGYSEEESREKVSSEQGKNGSFEEKLKKLVTGGISEEQAKKEIRMLAEKRGKINSDSHRRAQEKDPTYLRSMSHQCKEFWMKKGFSESESIDKASEVCERNRRKFREKLDSGEIEKGWNNTTLEYYLKKGMTIDEAKAALINRQSYTLEKCISKYGQEKGTRKWQERQEKWKNSIYSGESAIAVGTSKIFKEFLSKLDNDVRSEFFIRTSDQCFIFDVRKNKNLIEFNGDYWHCNPNIYSSAFLHPVKNMTAEAIWKYDDSKIKIAESRGFQVLIIWESEYKLDPVGTINKCKEFLKS